MYEHKEYPKWVYKNGDGRIVQNSEEEKDAGKDGWGDRKPRGRPKKAVK